MGKFHINSKGVPALCKATKGRCPFGEHYDTKEQAQVAADNELENEFSLLSTGKMSTQRKRDLSELIKRISGTESPGFEHECFAALSLAEDMNLDRIAITDDNGLTVNISTGEEKDPINANLFVDRSIEGVKSYYEKIGVPIRDETKLARVVYHSDDINKEILVQSGGPNVLDAAIIKADEVVDIVEVKELGRGAQLPATSLNIMKDGSISEDSLDNQSPHMRDALSNLKIQDADGKDIQLDFGSEAENKILPLYHFVEQYKKKGATAFVYMTNDGETVNKVDLTGPDDVVVGRLIDHKIEANVTLRANLSRQNATEDDIYRFNNILSREYFNSGRPSHTESFTLKGIREDKITRSGKYVRVGGYILPIEYENYQKNLNKRIKKTDLKAFRLVLTGNIKSNY